MAFALLTCSLHLLLETVFLRYPSPDRMWGWRRCFSPSLIITSLVWPLTCVFREEVCGWVLTSLHRLSALWCKFNPTDSPAKIGVMYHTTRTPTSPSSIFMPFSPPQTQCGVLLILSLDVQFIWICLFLLLTTCSLQVNNLCKTYWKVSCYSLFEMLLLHYAKFHTYLHTFHSSGSLLGTSNISVLMFLWSIQQQAGFRKCQMAC